MAHSKERIVIGNAEPSPPVRAILDGIRSKLKGQDQAVAALAPALELDCSPMREYRHNELLGVFPLLGPPGVGKTELTYLFARFAIGHLLNDAEGKPIEPLTLVDCTAFVDAHHVSKLTGGTHDYVGFGKETALYQDNLDHYAMQVACAEVRENELALKRRRTKRPGASLTSSEKELCTRYVENAYRPFRKVLLFDELPEAHPALHNFLLTILNGKPLTFSDGEVTDFTRTALFMTGNVGMDEIRKIQKGGLGFATVRDSDPDVLNARIKHEVEKAYDKFFRPPFISRTRENVIVFRFLGVKEFEDILDLQLSEIEETFRLAYGQDYPGVKIVFTPEAKTFLLEKGVDLANGARRLKGVVLKQYLAALARLMNWQGTAPGAERLKAGDTLVFEREADALETYVER